MPIKIRNCCFVFVTYYVSFCLVGCTTAAAWKHADAYANREPKYWSVNDVTFAAIKDQRFVRMCVKLEHFSEETMTEMEIDLYDLANNLHHQSTMAKSAKERNKFKQDGNDTSSGSKSENNSYMVGDIVSCEAILKKDEELLPVIVKKTDTFDTSEALLEIDKESPNFPAVFLIKQEDKNSIVFGTPMNMYPDLSNHVFSCLGEDQKESARYLLVPLGFAGDVFAVLFTTSVILVCILVLPICIYEMATNDNDSSSGGFQPFVKYFPLPPDTLHPECK